MSVLVFEINAISELALQVMQAVVTKNAETQTIQEDDSGPLAVAAALSDFFEICAALESGNGWMDTEQISEFADYGLDLLDRMAYQARELSVFDKQEHLFRLYPSLALWLIRRDAVLNNLEGTADGFGRLVNDIEDRSELAEICRLMHEVIESTSEQLQLDEDRGNASRPWRVINLNTGIAATRSLNPELMEETFEKLGRRLPNDMPEFLADGQRRMAFQNIPEPVKETINRYVKKWPAGPVH